MQTSNLTQTRPTAIRSLNFNVQNFGAFTKNIFLVMLLISASILATGCASNGDEDTESVRRSKLAPDEAAKRLYERGDRAMTGGNYQGAIRSFEQLETQYPLSKTARQSQLNLIYCYYKLNNNELAIDSANQFIKENPIHKKLDYVYYLLGLVHFDAENSKVENLLRIDRTKRPQKEMQDSLEYFQTLITKYPQSEYTPDAKQRMIFIRERLANHDLRVAQYYSRRGIHIAAVNRAKNILDNYPDTVAARNALDILEVGYTTMGMNDLAADVRRVKQAN